MTETAGQRIKRRRLELGYSQLDFCKLVGMAQSTLSELERGESKLPSAKHLKKLSSALSVSDSWIIYGQEGDLNYPTEEDTKILNALKSLTAEEKRAVYDIVMGLAKK